MLSSVFLDLAIAAPEILLPVAEIDQRKWSVIACDQYTSEPAYWKQVEQLVGDDPSTLRMILPEVFLETHPEEDISQKIQTVNQTIRDYVNRSMLRKLPPGFIVLSRSTAFHGSRKGLILAADLEQYDFTPGNKNRIRATEETVLSRIPPRVTIRSDALLELPHIMLLIDDPEYTVIEPAYAKLRLDPENIVYDTELMMGGGHVTGLFAEVHSSCSEKILNALTCLLQKSDDGFLFAVGDGNHSLASAQAHWKNVQEHLTPEERATHPARFALVEVVNIHDPGLDFEPIHRIVFGLSKEIFQQEANRYFADQGYCVATVPELTSDIFSKISGQNILITDGTDHIQMTLSNPKHSLAVESLQEFLDGLTSKYPDLRIDYIHGEESIKSLSGKNAVGFILPSVSKHSFFQTISSEGVFPRKTFSMGQSQEKRYYLEAKFIVQQTEKGDF